MIGYDYKRDLLLLLALFSPAAGFSAVQQLTTTSVRLSPRITFSTALSYSRQIKYDPYSGNGDSVSFSSGRKTRTAFPLSNSLDAHDIPMSRSSFALSNSTAAFVAPFDYDIEKSSSSSKDGFALIVDKVMSSYIGPRLLLAAVACLYGTNFPLGSIMDHALPASAATSARMVFAAAALSPFIWKLPRELIGMSLLAGCFTASGYVTQSLALVDTSPATVSFLGAATVIWCPFLEWLLHKTPMGWKDRPQTWISGIMCMMGVGILELCGSEGVSDALGNIGLGDALAILQAIGFGTGLFLSEQMMKKHPTKALPITAVMVATTALVAMLWSLSDGWIGNAPGWESMTLPNMLFDPSMREVAMAVVWTGLLSTSLNFFLEVFALGKVPSGEASVILASEPLWAAAFASVLLGEEFGWNDYYGGALIVTACIVSSLQVSDFQGLMSPKSKELEVSE